MQVLIAEDDPVALELLSGALRQMGHEVLTAMTGREGLEVLRDTKCRLVISDWEMPQMDGLELCRAIRSGKVDRYVYVILLTCREGTPSVVEGLSAGADDFMSKPFDPNELAVRIRAGERILALETRDLAIFALAKLAESRDRGTGAHLERVRIYSRILTRQLADHGRFPEEIDEEFVRLMYVASPLHDIGKVGIPDHILLKPDQLDPEEFEIMKTHTTLGAETLASALELYPDARLLRMARDIAACHHERFDGTGYPAGLAGEDIPLCGRIFAVADVYDALVSRRAYKGAYAHDAARRIIVEGSGTHFDPRIVQAFIRRESEFRAVAVQDGRTGTTAADPDPRQRGLPQCGASRR